MTRIHHVENKKSLRSAYLYLVNDHFRSLESDNDFMQYNYNNRYVSI